MSIETLDDIAETVCNGMGIYGEERSEYIAEFKERVREAVRLEKLRNGMFDTVQVLSIKPGDRCVLRANGPISEQACKAFQDYWQFFAGSIPLLVIGDGMELSVLREEGKG